MPTPLPAVRTGAALPTPGARRDRVKSARILIDDPKKRRVFEQLPAGSAAGRTRAMLKIQDGCQNFCAYCIIPYARGPIRSLPLEQARAEAARLGAEGYREIVVTGIEISSYGTDLSGPVAHLCRRVIAQDAPDARVRPVRSKRRRHGRLLRRLKAAQYCAHFHLSLQGV